MANEEDMLNDINDLEDNGEWEQANLLREIMNEGFYGSGKHSKITQKLVKKYESKYGRMDNYLG